MATFLVLMRVGGEHPEQPWTITGQIATAVYFGYFLVIVPVIGVIENTLMDVAVPATDHAAITASPAETVRSTDAAPAV